MSKNSLRGLLLVPVLTLGAAFSALAGPDLYISEFQLSPNPPVQGQPVQVRIGVYNRGDTRSGRYKVYWWPGENYPRPAKSWVIDGSNARGGRILNFTYPGYPSWYANLVTKVLIRTATDDNKGNNLFRKTISVAKPGAGVAQKPGRPDIYVSEFQLSPSIPVQGQPVRVRVGVYNRGNAPAGPYKVQWWPGENYTKPAKTWTVSGNNARGGKILTFTYPGYPSWYARLVTKLVVDTGDAVSESNEGNNVFRKVISVKGR